MITALIITGIVYITGVLVFLLTTIFEYQVDADIYEPGDEERKESLNNVKRSFIWPIWILALIYYGIGRVRKNIKEDLKAKNG